MAPHEIRRPFKRRPISDQQKRRELSLIRQTQHRSDAQQRARNLASSLISLQSSSPDVDPEILSEAVPELVGTESESSSFDVRQASRLRGPEARKWFAKQLMLPEWMIDVPDNLSQDWYCFFLILNPLLLLLFLHKWLIMRIGWFFRYVLARPAGKRCFVVSSDGTTVSRVRNGSTLHLFPSALPGGARKKGASGPANSYSILDCIFHEVKDSSFSLIYRVYPQFWSY